MVLALGLNQYVVAGLVVLFLLVCLVLILVILIQRPQGGGLSGAFGSGGGAGQTAFGTKTGDALTIATIGMFVIYLGVAIGLNFALRPGATDIPGEELPAATDTGDADTDTSDAGADTGADDATGDEPATGTPDTSPADDTGTATPDTEPEPSTDGRGAGDADVGEPDSGDAPADEPPGR